MYAFQFSLHVCCYFHHQCCGGCCSYCFRCCYCNYCCCYWWCCAVVVVGGGVVIVLGVDDIVVIVAHGCCHRCYIMSCSLQRVNCPPASSKPQPRYLVAILSPWLFYRHGSVIRKLLHYSAYSFNAEKFNSFYSKKLMNGPTVKRQIFVRD